MCGIFGIVEDGPIVESVYHGIVQLQHRGQDAAGIFVFDPKTGESALHKNKGLVSQVFTSDRFPLPEASWGIGHVRYATIGIGSVADTQPLCLNGNTPIALALNGNITNYVLLRRELEADGTVFETACDAEALLHLFARGLPADNIRFEDICEAVDRVLHRASGAYSVVVLIAGCGMVAFRDRHGIRPLLYATRHGERSHAFASETLALSALGFEKIEDIKPGEFVFVDAEHRAYRKQLNKLRFAPCSFEYTYFSKPNNVFQGREVYGVRSKLGGALAQHIRDAGFAVDVVVPIPSTSRPSAIALARVLGVCYEEGFVKQDYVGRTFIMSTQRIRQKALSTKLSPVSSVMQGRSVILVDDSIVRGTVSKRAVQLARKAGANKVYFASTFPPIRHPCIYGIDFPKADQLIAAGKTVEEVAAEIDADGVIYNTVEDLKDAVGLEGLCAACLTGEYPTALDGVDELQKLRSDDLEKMDLSCRH